jgi:hypothetical protein
MPLGQLMFPIEQGFVYKGFSTIDGSIQSIIQLKGRL